MIASFLRRSSSSFIVTYFHLVFLAAGAVRKVNVHYFGNGSPSGETVLKWICTTVLEKMFVVSKTCIGSAMVRKKNVVPVVAIRVYISKQNKNLLFFSFPFFSRNPGWSANFGNSEFVFLLLLQLFFLLILVETDTKKKQTTIFRVVPFLVSQVISAVRRVLMINQMKSLFFNKVTVLPRFLAK